MEKTGQGEKELRNNDEEAITNNSQGLWNRRRGLILIVVGTLLFIAGSMIPWLHVYWGDSGSLLNNPKVLAIFVSIILICPIVAIYSELTSGIRAARMLVIILLAYSIILTIIGSVVIVAWTMAIIDKEFSFAPGLYIIYLGIITLLVGSINHFRRMRGPVEK